MTDLKKTFCRSSLIGSFIDTYKFIFLFYGSLIYSSTVCAQTVPPVNRQDIYALQDFYLNTDGPNWTIGSGIPWNFTSIDSQNPCADPVWFGVVCTYNTENSFISELHLRKSYLVGTIPSSLVNLTKLSTLELIDNLISGNFPTELSALSLLSNISLSYNYLTGSLPDNLPEFANLTVLNLFYNYMDGTIPPNIVEMSQITQLALGDNYFSGTIPSEIGRFKLLTDLGLEVNKLTGSLPPEIGNVTSLRSVDISKNDISGSLPTELGNLADLSELAVYTNRINGTVPASIGNLSQLHVLSIYGNRISGTIPLELCGLSYLNVFNIFNNKMTGTLPPELGQLTELVGLKLSYNMFIGHIPAELGNLVHLDYLMFDYNMLTGTIPNALGNLLQLIYFDAQNNNLNGTIPSELMQCTELIQIALNNNELTGTLPENIGNLQSVQGLYLNNNLFTGSLPSSIGDCSELLLLELYTNSLNGTIPNEIIKLSKLTELVLYENNLNGTLPSEMGQMTELQLVDVHQNVLTGSIPDSVSRLTQLFELIVNNNQLTGPIPESIGNIASLMFFFSQSNQMTGTIPSSMCNLTQIIYLYAYYNHLSGSIPDCIGNVTSFVVIDVGYNMLTGTVPNSITNLINLNFVALYSNSFTGSLSNTFNSLQALETLEWQINQITGLVPSSLFELPNLHDTQLSFNYFTGSLPSSFASNSSLSSMDFGQCLLSGTVPTSFSLLPLLASLVLQNNTLSGSLTTVFNSTVQSSLTYVDLTYNQFTGEIPSEVFKIPTLQQIGLISNCMSGTIPIEICGANQLTTLLLDGLSAGSSCQSKIFPNIPASTSYYLTKHLTGHIPSCLFNAPALQTLHLSGNSITGSIASDVVLSPSLTALSMSHNQLTGTIPSAIQSHNFSDLDVSFNKFTGVLGSTFSDTFGNGNNSITMEVNRLSGNIPASLTDAYNIQLVNGNMFSCGITNRNTLPAHDETSKNYQCGSNTLNLSMYIFAALIALSIAIVFICYVKIVYSDENKWVSPAVTAVKQWYLNAIHIQFDNHIGQYIRLLTRYRQYMFVLCTVLLILLLPTYGALSAFYSTYQYAYAWTVSAAFLSGVLPGCVLYSAWMLLICTLLCVVYRSSCSAHNSRASTGGTENINGVLAIESNSLTVKKRLFIALLVVVNLIVVVGINVFYVWVTLNADSPFAITLTEMFVALFKLVWNDVVVPRLFIYARATDHLNLMQLRVAILLFNNILAPCAATAVVSPNCFYYVFTNAQPVTTVVDITICATISSSGSCVETELVYVEYSYAPPYIYSFRCSSTLVTNYASIFVYMYLIDAFVKPLYLAALRYAYVHRSVFRVIGDVLLPNIIKPMAAANLNVPNKPLVNKHMMVLSMINTCAILLTFGVVFPLLAVVIAVDVVVVTFTLQLLVGRVSFSDNVTLLQQYTNMLNVECDGVESLFRSSVWVVVPVAAVFYSMFLFDIIGDDVGWQKALWAPLSIIAAPVLALILVFVINSKSRSDGHTRESSVGDVSLRNRESEMVSVGNPLIHHATNRTNTTNRNHEVTCLERGSEF